MDVVFGRWHWLSLLKIEAKDRILKNLDEVNKKIRYIEDIIRNVNYPFYRVVIWDKYIMNKSYRMITQTYGVDVENLRKHVNKELQRAIQVYNSDSAEALKKWLNIWENNKVT